MPAELEETDAVDRLYRRLVENLEDLAVLIVDTELGVITWNRGAELLYGYSAAEMVGASIELLYTPEDRAGSTPRREIEAVRSTGRMAINRWQLRSDGSRFWASGVLTKLKDAAGNSLGFVQIIRDETANKLRDEERSRTEQALQASEQKFRRLIDANLIGVGISSADGIWLDANDALLETLGHTRQDLLQGSVRWDEMTPEEYRQIDQQSIDEANRRGACTPYEKEYIRPDGIRISVLIGYATVSGVRDHYVCFVLDLSPQKRVEKELREADRRKDEFLAMLAHELRNPLAPIRASLEVLKLPDLDQALLQQTRDIMERQTVMLVRLVDDLLDMSRITQGKIELKRERTTVKQVVDAALETSWPVIDSQEHDLELSIPKEPIPLLGDPVRLAQCLSNLLNNAAKYTPRHGRVCLEAVRQGAEVKITVGDNGIGISPDRLPQVFELFSQIDPDFAHSQGGLGIGLTLVKRLVELHGGRVEAHSGGTGCGSEFSLILPIAEAENRSDGQVTTVTKPVRTLKIVVVDDNVDAAQMLAFLLKALGHQTATVHSAQQALTAVEGCDLVLMDIGLPVMDGYTLARAIRSRLGENTPVLAAVTGYGQQEDRERSRAAGMQYHLVKPVAPERLLEVLREVAESGSAASGQRSS